MATSMLNNQRVYNLLAILLAIYIAMRNQDSRSGMTVEHTTKKSHGTWNLTMAHVKSLVFVEDVLQCFCGCFAI